MRQGTFANFHTGCGVHTSRNCAGPKAHDRGVGERGVIRYAEVIGKNIVDKAEEYDAWNTMPEAADFRSRKARIST